MQCDSISKIYQMFVIPRSNPACLNEPEKPHKPTFNILIREEEATIRKPVSEKPKILRGG